MPERSAVPPHLAAPLARCADRATPTGVALMSLLVEATSLREAEGALRAARAGADPASATRLTEALALLADNPQAWATVKGVIGGIEHGGTAAAPGEGLAHWAALFDRAARTSPEASVALYSLGNPDLLRAATEELVRHLDAWGVLGPERAMLDLGCGIGRLAAALAPRVGRVVGIDISGEMVATARRLHGGWPNARFEQVGGADLRAFPDRAFGLVLAVDSFPYLVQSGGRDLAAAMLAEAWRVLEPGGDLVILNYSYRGDPAADRAELAETAGGLGLEPLREGIRPFSTWDGLAFHWRKR